VNFKGWHTSRLPHRSPVS